MVVMPQILFIDKVVDVPHIMKQQASVSRKDRSVPKIILQIVEAPRLVPQEFKLSPREDDTDGDHRLGPQKRKSISESGMTEDEPSERDVRRASASSCEA